MNNLIWTWVSSDWVYVICPKITEVYYLVSNNLNVSILKSSYTHCGGWDVTNVTNLSTDSSTDFQVTVSSCLIVSQHLHHHVGKRLFVI